MVRLRFALAGEVVDYGPEVRGCEVRHKILSCRQVNFGSLIAPWIDNCDFGNVKIAGIARG